MGRSARAQSSSADQPASVFTERLDKLECNHAFRDLKRMIKNHIQFEMEPMLIRIPHLCAKTNEAEMIDHPAVLPQKTFHFLSQFNEAFDSRVLGGSSDHASSYWRQRNGR